ncbi:sensor histidine kinase [Brachybacterium sp. YJGR34]|uniref:sensor histidine kinase n=1 Tax=Brachybacterium sp. YJGR34 TaxID=2059911 RepID=UPI0013003A6D|nr:sensor histidine kinase [Brachybacterium sp. YJGR34]
MVTLRAPAPWRVESSEHAGPRRPGPARTGRLGELLEVWLPPMLVPVSWGAGWIASQTWLSTVHVAWSLIPALLLLGTRWLLERTLVGTGRGSRALTALYPLHLMLVAISTLLNPMTCIYAFVGYIDSARFLTGTTGRLVVVATALLCAVGQLGGIRVVVAEVWFFVALAVVNLVVAAGMMVLAGDRERALDEREQAVREIERMHRENARLQEELLARAREAGVEEERGRLSREIHDTVAQGLVGVIRQLEAVGQGVDGAARHRIGVAEEAARDCLLEARRAVEGLAPHQLSGADAADALAALVARWARTYRVVATVDVDDAPRTGRHDDVLLRIAQEALANIARHAGAGAVTVHLGGDAEVRVLRIEDDGRGFDASAAPRGHGLANMAERARRAGGELEVRTAPGAGCTITARLPR